MVRLQRNADHIIRLGGFFFTAGGLFHTDKQGFSVR